MFILISAWRRTDVEGLLGLDMHKRVQIRMGEAMKVGNTELAFEFTSVPFSIRIQIHAQCAVLGPVWLDPNWNRFQNPSRLFRWDFLKPNPDSWNHETNSGSGIIMSAMASQITSLAIVYSTVYSGADPRKHQSSASLGFMRGIQRWPMNSPHKWPVTRKMVPFGDVIMNILSFVPRTLPSQSPSRHSLTSWRLASEVSRSSTLSRSWPSTLASPSSSPMSTVSRSLRPPWCSLDGGRRRTDTASLSRKFSPRRKHVSDKIR